MKAVIFLGPSLPLREAREVLDAIYLPPAAQADLLNAVVNHRPDVIGLVDGVFLQSLSVWHKEILFALSQGIAVYGASSMGALRAAETAAFGTLGIGEIYRRYAEGELDDDEVALAYGPAEMNYRKLSEPMINVRATLEAAEQAGIIDAGLRTALVSMAKATYFQERTFPGLLARAEASGVAPQAVRRLAEFVRTNYVDLKRQDAIALLHAVKGHTAAERRPADFAFKRSTVFETLYNRDRRVPVSDTAIPLEAIANHAALNDVEFDQSNFDACNRAVVHEFALMLGIQPSEQQIQSELARFSQRNGLDAADAMSAWLLANHLSQEELIELMKQVACCRAMHGWFRTLMWMEKTTKLVLDELRLRGRYPEAAARAAAHEGLVDSMATGVNGSTARVPLDHLLAEHAHWTGRVVPGDPSAWLDEAGFHTEGNLRMELGRARLAREAIAQLLASASEGAHTGGLGNVAQPSQEPEARA